MGVEILDKVERLIRNVNYSCLHGVASVKVT